MQLEPQAAPARTFTDEERRLIYRYSVLESAVRQSTGTDVTAKPEDVAEMLSIEATLGMLPHEIVQAEFDHVFAKGSVESAYA